MDPLSGISSNSQQTTSPSGAKSLSPQDQQEVQRLKEIDQKVRAHEDAHKSAAGGLSTGAASYSYATGPDGKRYAVAGEVSIDTSSESTPQATIAKMQMVERAALAPSDPSPQDRAVASRAVAIEQQARLQEQQQNSPSNSASPNSATAPSDSQSPAAGTSPTHSKKTVSHPLGAYTRKVPMSPLALPTA